MLIPIEDAAAPSPEQRGRMALDGMVIDAIGRPLCPLSDDDANRGRQVLARCDTEARQRDPGLGAIGLVH